MIYLILKTMFFFIYLVFYIKLFNLKDLDKIKILDLSLLLITIILIINSLISIETSFFKTTIPIIIITISNYIYKYFTDSKIKVNYEDNNFTIYETLNKLRLKTLKKILSKYNL